MHLIRSAHENGNLDGKSKFHVIPHSVYTEENIISVEFN